MPYPFPGPFDYRVPDDLAAEPGDVVLVPLNRREEIGVVWDGPSDASVPDHKLKPLIGLIDTPPMQADLRRFVDWVAAYTLAPPGEVMAMALRVPRKPTGPASGWRRAASPPETRLTDARQKILDVLARAEPRTTSELARVAGVSVAVVRGMADLGLLVAEVMAAPVPFSLPDPAHPGATLAPDQATAA